MRRRTRSTSAKLAIQRHVKEREVSNLAGDLQADTYSPDVDRLQGELGAGGLRGT